MSTSSQLPLAGMEPPVVAGPDREGQANVDDISTAVDTSIARTGQAEVAYIKTGQLLTKTTGFMDAYDFTLNPYSGCSFGCTYCYAAFFSRDTAKRDNWGYWVSVKANAIELLNKRRRSLDGELIYMSSVTDPYQPVERQLELTRRLLGIMAERWKPKLVVQTRSPLVERDCDLFRRIEDNGGRVQVNMTVTTDDEDIRRTFEPFCPANHRRLAAIRAVQAAGIDTCITMTPLLLVNDNDAFAADLIGTGARKFIAQTFHFNRGKFVAQTRNQAFDLMAEKLGCERDNFVGEYVKRYRQFFKVLSNRLSEHNLPPLGEGKDGFAPPF